MKIPISKIDFSNEDKEAVIKVLDSGWVVQGPSVEEFEKRWSEFTGSKYSVAVSNCTNALQLSLSAVGIGSGDEIIVPSFTWIASANAVEALNAKPIFCDIDLDTFNINPDLIEQLITSKTKAIMPVHLFGLSADMYEILKIAKKYNLIVIEDAACGFGSKYKGKHVGNFGLTGCFSFHPRKAITTGEGGMITTNNESISSKLKSMRDHGAAVSDLQRHMGNKPYLLPDFPYAGYNFRMTDIQGALGLTQMKRANEILLKRKAIAERYNEALKEIDWLKLPYQNADYSHGFQAYVCLFSPDKITEKNVELVNRQRNKFMEYLFDKGISTRPGTHAVHNTTYYKEKYKIEPMDFKNSLISEKCSIALPLFPSISDTEFNYIIKTIKAFKYE